MYQDGRGGLSRPLTHIHLHKSVGNICRAIMDYSPFSFYVNGGKAMLETFGEIDLKNTLIGNDALELDGFILKSFGLCRSRKMVWSENIFLKRSIISFGIAVLKIKISEH
jgi:hypothetical protein